MNNMSQQNGTWGHWVPISSSRSRLGNPRSGSWGN